MFISSNWGTESSKTVVFSSNQYIVTMGWDLPLCCNILLFFSFFYLLFETNWENNILWTKSVAKQTIFCCSPISGSRWIYHVFHVDLKML